jgi:hypothetical protein
MSLIRKKSGLNEHAADQEARASVQNEMSIIYQFALKFTIHRRSFHQTESQCLKTAQLVPRFGFKVYRYIRTINEKISTEI